MAGAAAAAAGASILITVTDEGAGTSTTYSDYPPERYDKARATRSNSGGKTKRDDKLNPGNVYVARGVTKGVIVNVKEKHGSFRVAVPCMPLPMAIICCILNIFTPGFGKYIAQFQKLVCFSLLPHVMHSKTPISSTTY